MNSDTLHEGGFDCRIIVVNMMVLKMVGFSVVAPTQTDTALHQLRARYNFNISSFENVGWF